MLMYNIPLWILAALQQAGKPLRISELPFVINKEQSSPVELKAIREALSQMILSGHVVSVQVPYLNRHAFAYKIVPEKFSFLVKD